MTELSPEVLSRLDKLAAYIGTKTEALWEVLVRRGQAEAVANIVDSVVILVASYCLWRLGRWGLEHCKIRDDLELPGMFAVVLAGIGLIATPILFVISVRYAVIYSISPEFYAIDAIFGAFK